jgi:hypothetical protein
MTDIRDMLKFDEPTFTEGFTIAKIRTLLDSSFAGKNIYIDGLQNLTNNTWFEVVNQSGTNIEIWTKNVPLFSDGLPDSGNIAKTTVVSGSFVKIFFRNSGNPAFYVITQQTT